MKNKFKKLSQALTFVPALALGISFVFSGPAVFAEVGDNCENIKDGKGFSLQTGKDCSKGEGTPTELFGTGGILTTITNILLFLVASISVIMLIFGGVRYVTSAGNQNLVKGAKDTIMYAIIGLVISILAFALVNFVVTGIGKDSTKP